MKISVEERCLVLSHHILFTHKKAFAITSSLFRVGGLVSWSQSTEKQMDGAVILEPVTQHCLQRSNAWVGEPPQTLLAGDNG